ncbi:hypothetical protein V8J88_05875 [Massilia sp. W12]|uniref:hypothetical protein n=1 Tax=Massilia sp. W12 TaxID=3126507 RepID=UPI0030D43D93
MSAKILLPLLFCAQFGLAHAAPKEADCANQAKAKQVMADLSKKQAEDQQAEMQRNEALHKLMEKNPALAKLGKEQRAKFLLGLMSKPEVKAIDAERQKVMESMAQSVAELSKDKKPDSATECKIMLKMAQISDKTRPLNLRQHALLEKEINQAK